MEYHIDELYISKFSDLLFIAKTKQNGYFARGKLQQQQWIQPPAAEV